MPTDDDRKAGRGMFEVSGTGFSLSLSAMSVPTLEGRGACPLLFLQLRCRLVAII